MIFFIVIDPRYFFTVKIEHILVGNILIVAFDGVDDADLSLRTGQVITEGKIVGVVVQVPEQRVGMISICWASRSSLFLLRAVSPGA